MAVSTGGIVFGDDACFTKVEDIQIDDLGKVKEVIITKDDTLLLNGLVSFFLSGKLIILG